MIICLYPTPQYSNTYIQNIIIMEFEKLIRAEGIIKKQSIFDLQEAIQSIVDDMEEDGFELKDVKEFIQVQLNEILGE